MINGRLGFVLLEQAVTACLMERGFGRIWFFQSPWMPPSSRSSWTIDTSSPLGQWSSHRDRLSMFSVLTSQNHNDPLTNVMVCRQVALLCNESLWWVDNQRIALMGVDNFVSLQNFQIGTFFFPVARLLLPKPPPKRKKKKLAYPWSTCKQTILDANKDKF